MVFETIEPCFPILTKSGNGNYVKAQAQFHTAAITPCRTTRPGVASLHPAASNPRHSASEFNVATELSDVTLRRSAEKFFVLAAKVRRVFIAHAVPRARRVQVLAEH